jgi:general secretion pathway protein G
VKRHNKNPRQRGTGGFTLIEMMVTVAIVAILATMVLPMVEMTRQRIREQELHTDLRQIREAIDNYKKAVDEGRIKTSADETGYPKSLQSLVDGVEDIKSPTKAKIYFLRRIPRDPMNQDSQIPASDTWGKRSYESPPDDPQEGDDVYDVYSLSRQTGLNGVPYREW